MSAVESPVKVILNPYSGRGRAGRQREALCRALAQAGLAFDLEETRGPGHAIELARAAREMGYTTVVAAGGDGTVSEVMNGLAQAAGPDQVVGRLGLMPMGSANDFAAMVGCPRRLDQVARQIAAGRSRRVDLGFATYAPQGGETRQRYFDNNLGIGLEARVTLESYQIRWLSGTPLYVVAALRALHRYAGSRLELAWERPDGQVETRARATLMVTVGNTRRTGGGFYLTPDAVVDDGLLDVGIADAIPAWQVLTLLPLALFGRHTGHPAVTMIRCRRISVAGADGFPLHLDGEVVSDQAIRVDVTIQPGRLEVVGVGGHGPE